ASTQGTVALAYACRRPALLRARLAGMRVPDPPTAHRPLSEDPPNLPAQPPEESFDGALDALLERAGVQRALRSRYSVARLEVLGVAWTFGHWLLERLAA